MSLEGEPTAKKIVEVALVNQLVQKGTFELLSKGEVEAAQAAPEQDPTDWKGIATKAGADYILHANVLQFEAPIREGYSKQEVIDTQLAEERGTDGKTEQVYKVKAMNGHVKVRLTFTRLSDDDKRTAVAQADRQIEASAQAGAIHLPPKLRFLEELTNQAFQEFFEKFN